MRAGSVAVIALVTFLPCAHLVITAVTDRPPPAPGPVVREQVSAADLTKATVAKTPIV